MPVQTYPRFFFRFSGFAQSILSQFLKTLYVSIKSPPILLSCNVAKLSLFNLFSYSSFSKPVGILVALLCTFLVLSMSPCKCRLQACTAYFKCGLTRETYRSFHSPGYLLPNVLLSIPSVLFAFPTILSTCSLHFGSLPTITPKSDKRYYFRLRGNDLPFAILFFIKKISC